YQTSRYKSPVKRWGFFVSYLIIFIH
ncbi:uncharacterized protein METZ01_LOCUS322682, partial [marine metagenome]